MSWSDDTRCLYCDGKLPLYRKITSGQFCSAGHRKAYWQEQERLAVERLHQTHDSLRAYRPPEALEAPRREPVAAPPAPVTPAAPAKSFVEYAYQEGPTVEERARSASNTGQVKFAGFLVEPPPEPRQALSAEVAFDEPLWSSDESSWTWEMPRLSVALDTPEWQMDLEAPVPFGTPVPFFNAPGVDSPDVLTIREGSARLLLSPVMKSAEVGMRLNGTLETPEFEPDFVAQLPAVVETAPETETPAVTEPEPVVAMSASMLPLPRVAAKVSEVVARVAPQALLTSATAVNARYSTMPGLGANRRHTGTPVAAGLAALHLNTSPRRLETALRGTDPSAVDLSLTLDSPQREFDLPALAAGLRLAPGSRYALSGGNVPAAGPGNRTKAGETQTLLDLRSNDPQIVGLELQTGLGLAPGCKYSVSLNPGQIEKAAIRQAAATPVPAKSEIAMAALPAGLCAAELAPAFSRLQPLGFKAHAKPAAAAQPMAAGVAHAYPINLPMQPVTKWEPVEGQLQAPPKTGFLSTWSQAMSQVGENKDGEKKYVWSHVAEFWQHAPRDLKLLSIAIPVLLGLALRPSLPKVKVTAPVAGNVVEGSSFERGLKERLMVVRQTVAERAGVELNEDFRTGLDDWQTRGDLSHAWSFDSNGFVKPGALALYRPSIGLKDYEMEFLGLIDKKALSWVVRAADFDNYYVVKLVVLKPGPMPTLGITRYAVINGKAQNRVDTVAPINARTDTLYRVNLNVRDDSYLLTLQGQVVDNWTEPRLSSGGIGFFSQQGEESRLRWVQVTHQYDMLGRLCAYLAPYNISNTNGSW